MLHHRHGREADLRAAYREFVARQQAEGVTQTLAVAFEPELTADGGLPGSNAGSGYILI